MTSTNRDFFGWILLAYGVACAVAAAAGAMAIQRGVPPLGVALSADIAATVVVFGFSFAKNNSSFYDPYWSVAPIPIAIYWGTRPESADAPFLRHLLVVAAVTVWGCRLTYNWARSWHGLEHEDWRYVDLREKTGERYWLVSFAGIHMMPTLWVFFGCLSMYPALHLGRMPLGIFDILAAGVVSLAIWLESRADRELLEYRLSGPLPHDILSSGVWAWCRHPNYFGEMSFWWGLWLFGYAADPSQWAWTMIGPASITLMFRFVSLPMIEQRMAERRPGFSEYKKHSGLVLPRFWRI